MKKAVLKLDKHLKHTEDKEMEFELNYLKSLTVKERFEMMFRKSKEMFNLLKKNGHRKSSQIIKRT